MKGVCVNLEIALDLSALVDVSYRRVETQAAVCADKIQTAECFASHFW